jgi:hypothetical protein
MPADGRITQEKAKETCSVNGISRQTFRARGSGKKQGTEVQGASLWWVRPSFAQALVLGTWNFPGVWSLGFGAFTCVAA